MTDPSGSSQCYQALIAAERAAPADVRYRPPYTAWSPTSSAPTAAENCRTYRPSPAASARPPEPPPGGLTARASSGRVFRDLTQQPAVGFQSG